MPHSAIFTSTDPYAHQSSLRADAIEVVVTAPGSFRGEVTRIDLHKLWLQRSRESLPRVIHSEVSKDRNGVFFLANARQAPIRHTGKELLPGCVMVYSAGADHHHHSSAASHWAAISLGLEDLAVAGQAIAGRDLSPPKANQLIRPSPRLMDRLLRLHAAAGHLAATTPDILAHPEVAKAIEQELISVMVRCLTEDSAQPSHMANQRVPVMRCYPWRKGLSCEWRSWSGERPPPRASILAA